MLTTNVSRRRNEQSLIVGHTHQELDNKFHMMFYQWRMQVQLAHAVIAAHTRHEMDAHSHTWAMLIIGLSIYGIIIDHL